MKLSGNLKTVNGDGIFKGLLFIDYVIIVVKLIFFPSE